MSAGTACDRGRVLAIQSVVRTSLEVFGSQSVGGRQASILTLVYRDRELQPEAQWPPQP